MELAGKVALVTGGGRGIGRAIAVALAEAGADVAVAARSAVELEETAELVRNRGRRALAVPLDVSDPAAVEAAVRQVTSALGPVLILVNNAGVAPSLKFQETTDDLWQRTININLSGAFYCSRAVLPAMLEAGWGRIVNVASTAAKVGYLYNAAYVASKHGMLGLTRALALEVARKGVTVNAVCPGFVETDIARAAIDNLVAKTGRTADQARKALESMSPQGRLMTPEEVAAMVVYLTSEAARGINGQGIVIDGGGVQS
jgi:3-hydroxybutyrate dehydrogenase